MALPWLICSQRSSEALLQQGRAIIAISSRDKRTDFPETLRQRPEKSNPRAVSHPTLRDPYRPFLLGVHFHGKQIYTLSIHTVVQQ